jgi:hypothetical protein
MDDIFEKVLLSPEVQTQREELRLINSRIFCSRTGPTAGGTWTTGCLNLPQLRAEERLQHTLPIPDRGRPQTDSLGMKSGLQSVIM